MGGCDDAARSQKSRTALLPDLSPSHVTTDDVTPRLDEKSQEQTKAGQEENGEEEDDDKKPLTLNLNKQMTNNRTIRIGRLFLSREVLQSMRE